MKTHRSRKKAGAPAALERDAAALRDALAGLVRVCQLADRGTICCHDVSVTQCYAIDALARHGPLTLNQLASELYCDKTTASRVVGALERKGYVTRKAHAGDRRSILLQATAAGRRLIEVIHGEQVGALTDLLAGIGAEVRTAATQLVGRLAQAVAARCCGEADPAACGAVCASESNPRSRT